MRGWPSARGRLGGVSMTTGITGRGGLTRIRGVALVFLPLSFLHQVWLFSLSSPWRTSDFAMLTPPLVLERVPLSLFFYRWRKESRMAYSADQPRIVPLIGDLRILEEFEYDGKN